MAIPPDIEDSQTPIETAEEEAGIINDQEEEEVSTSSDDIEIQMMKNTTFELPMETSLGEDQTTSPPLPSFTLSLKEVTKGGSWRFADGGLTTRERHNESLDSSEYEGEFNENEEFDYLEITLSVGGDDPRVKALDVYTQYAGINTILIKHAPKSIWPAGIAFYGFYPDWDDLEDRVLEVGETRPTTIKRPADYAAATGLFAKSWPLEGSENGKITVGMCRGLSDEGGEAGNYSQVGDTGVLSADLGHTIEFDPDDMSSGCALESHNPICSYTYIWRDYHPIPLSIYNVWGRIDDASYGSLSPHLVADAMYETEWLKAGKIISRTGSGPYNYGVRCVTHIKSSSNWSTELVSVTGELMKFEIGRWVMISKQGESTWSIIPTSQLYWEQAVDWLRRGEGF